MGSQTGSHRPSYQNAAVKKQHSTATLPERRDTAPKSGMTEPAELTSTSSSDRLPKSAHGATSVPKRAAFLPPPLFKGSLSTSGSARKEVAQSNNLQVSEKQDSASISAPRNDTGVTPTRAFLKPSPKIGSEKLKKHAPSSNHSSKLSTGLPQAHRQRSESAQSSIQSAGNTKTPLFQSPVRDNNDIVMTDAPHSPTTQFSHQTEMARSKTAAAKLTSQEPTTMGPKGTTTTRSHIKKEPMDERSRQTTENELRAAGSPVSTNWTVKNAFDQPRDSSKANANTMSPEKVTHSKTTTEWAHQFKDSEICPIFQRHLDEMITVHQNQVKVETSRNQALDHSLASSQKNEWQSKWQSKSNNHIQKPSAFARMKPAESKTSVKSSSSAKLRTENICLTNPDRLPYTTHTKASNNVKYQASGTQVPRYSGTSTMRYNILSENVKRLAVWPYMTVDDEEEKLEKLYPELKERYTQGNPDDRHDLLDGRERLKQTAPYVEGALAELRIPVDDILRIFFESKGAPADDDDEAEEIFDDPGAEEPTIKEKWVLVHSVLSPSTSAGLKNAASAVAAYYKIEQCSIWPTAKYLYQLREKAKSGSTTTDKNLSPFINLPCSICQTHNCDCHGEIIETSATNDEESNDHSETDSSDDDDESTTSINLKVLVNAPVQQHDNEPHTIAYQAPVGKKHLGDPMSYAGMNADGSITGQWIEGLDSPDSRSQPSNGLNDQSLCSATCFWEKSQRSKTTSVKPWTQVELAIFEEYLCAYGNTKRAPCLIALAMSEPCIEIFVKMLARSVTTISTTPTQAISNDGKKLPLKKPGHKTIANRQPFVPCGHKGSCEDAKCSCYTEGVFCETSCRCAKGCDRRFRGCNCPRAGRICFQNRKCPCFAYDRECDADLCGTCGADEVLDPLRKYEADICVKRCKNVGIQRNVPKRTIVGSSEVNGLGLFAGEAIKKHEYVAEYKGEIISCEESDRRGLVYDYLPANYLFKLNNSQDLDAMYQGNKTRFINSSSDELNRNCEPALLLCKTETRIGMYALRDIQPGEELFFDYRYPPSKTEHFVEKSTTSNGQTVLVKAKASKPGQRRVRRKADAQSSLLSGLKQTTDGDNTDQAMDTEDSERKGGRQNMNGHNMLESDYDEEQAEAETFELLRKIQENEGNDDDDYKDEEDDWRATSPEDQEERIMTRMQRTRASASTQNTPVKGTPTKTSAREHRGRKRARSP